MNDRWRGDALLLLAVALLSRAITFGNPILHADEQFYFVAARFMGEGAWPYSDVWDRKPVGLFLLYWPAARLPLPWGIWAYQALALAAAVATAAMAVRLAREAGWVAGARIAGVAYLLWIALAEGAGGQSPVFYNALVAGAALLICGERGERGERGGQTRRGLVAMLLIGCAMQVKASAVFEGMFFGLWAAWQHWRAHRTAPATLGLAAAMAVVAAAPTLLAAGVFAVHGRLDAWWYANFRSILERRTDPWAEQFGNLAGIVAILSPVVAMAGVTLAQGRVDATRVFLFGWLGAALTGIAVFGSWFDHYALPAMLPAAICAAGAMGEHRDVRRWMLPVLAMVAVGGQGLLVLKRLGRGTPAQFAALAQAVGRGPGCLWVQSGETMLHAATGRCRVSRYVFPSHLGRIREQGAIGVDQAGEVRRILAARPAVIVMRPPYRGERTDLRAIVSAEIALSYRETAVVRLGSNVVRVFKHAA